MTADFFQIVEPPSSGEYQELFGGRVVNVAAGAYYDPPVNILIRNGHIEALLQPGQPSPLNTVRFDMSGRALIPGLINTHIHIQLARPALLASPRDIRLMAAFKQRQIEKNLAECLAHGVTTIRDAWSGDLRQNRLLSERIARDEIPGPRLVQAVLVSQLGGSFAPHRRPGSGLFLRFADIPNLPYDHPACGVVAFSPPASIGEVRCAVDQAIDERGAQAIKIYEQREARLSYRPGATLMSQDQLDALVDQARRRGLPTTMHHVTVESFSRGACAGVTSLVHLPGDAPLPEEAAQAFLRAGCILEPTFSLAYDLSWDIPANPRRTHSRQPALDTLRNRSFAALAEEFLLPELVPPALNGMQRSKANRLRLLGLINLEKVFSYYSGMLTDGMDNAARLWELGAALACGNDAGAVQRTEGMLHLELELFAMALQGCQRTFTPAEALRAATLTAARSLGMEQQLGSLQPGGLADITVLDGDPLADFSCIGGRAAAVFVAGRLVYNACGLSRRRIA